MRLVGSVQIGAGKLGNSIVIGVKWPSHFGGGKKMHRSPTNLRTGRSDEIMLAGLIPLLKHRFSKLILEVDERLVTLFARSFPEIEVRKQFAKKDEDFDWHIPIADLPIIPRNTKISNAIEISKVDPDIQETIASKFTDEANGRLIVGFSWQSGATSALRSIGYTPISFYKDLILNERILPVCLQYGDIGST